jgi:hypothetical protein
MNPHAFRIERDFSLTRRTPAGHAIGRGSPAGMAGRLRHANNPGTQKPYKLDLSRIPRSLKATQATPSTRQQFSLWLFCCQGGVLRDSGWVAGRCRRPGG